MRLKLLRRRLSVSAPRMIVRSHLPWPLRWAVVALALGLCAALALWAFEFGKGLAGIDGRSSTQMLQLHERLATLQQERDRATSVANTAESLLLAERTTREQLAQQLKAVEAENLRLKGDLGFFERLLPSTGGEDIAIRALQVEPRDEGGLRLQMLLMRPGRQDADFTGRYAVTLSGTLNGRPWSEEVDVGRAVVRLRQYARLEQLLTPAAGAVVKAVQVRIFDDKGTVRTAQTARL